MVERHRRDEADLLADLEGLLADGQQINMDRLSGEETADEDATAAVPLGERIAIVNAMIDRLPKDGPVTVVGHSMGGLVISQMAELAPERINHLIYVAAFLPRDGQSLLDLIKTQEGPGIQVAVERAGKHSTVLNPERAAPILFPDATPAQQAAALNEASELYLGALPFGETGQAETIDLFMDVCVDRFTKDLNATFEIAKDSGYDVITERSNVVHNRKTDEKIPVIRARTRSPASGQDKSECPIRLDIDYSSYGALCKVRLDKPCDFFDPEGAFLEKNLLASEFVSLSDGTAERDRLGAASPLVNDCSGTTTSVSDLMTRTFEISHPDGEPKSVKLEYMRCNSRYVALTAFIPWIEG